MRRDLRVHECHGRRVRGWQGPWNKARAEVIAHALPSLVEEDLAVREAKPCGAEGVVYTHTRAREQTKSDMPKAAAQAQLANLAKREIEERQHATSP